MGERASARPGSSAALAESLAGRRLWGDDFDAAEIEDWYRDEQEAYSDLVTARAGPRPGYAYHALNERHGFSALPPGRFERALGFGSAWGEEFAPIADRIGALTIVEPSQAWDAGDVCGVPTERIAPEPSGRLPLPDARFDLVCCLSALHHVPNVSRVVGELARVLRRGGHLLLREPVVSLGDWSQPRPGLTKRERGIPLPLFRETWRAAGLEVVRESLCYFPLTPRLRGLTGRNPFLSARAVALDAWLSRLFAWNLRYHRRTLLEKACPTCVFAVLVKS